MPTTLFQRWEGERVVKSSHTLDSESSGNGLVPLSVSVVVITKNEEANIDDCLSSVGWVREIIVVDAESTDRTREKALQHTPRVFTKTWEGFGLQKNYGMSQATSSWVLILDADERVSPLLAYEIQEVLEKWSNDDPVAFEIPRRNYFYGRWVKWGGAYPDLQIRLFQTGKAVYNQVEVHENLVVDGEIGRLSGHLEHYTERTIADHFKKFSLYSTLSAQERAKRSQQVYWWQILLNPMVTFIKKYCLKQGYRDGIRGIIFAGFSSMYTFGKYVKLWEMEQDKAVSNK